jgi:hypothetical protein
MLLADEEVVEDADGRDNYKQKDVMDQGLEQMRSNSATDHSYMHVLHMFGPAMLGVMAWTEMKKSQKICDVMTVTDEAFIHLVLNNYSARWTMMAERMRYNQPMVS